MRLSHSALMSMLAGLSLSACAESPQAAGNLGLALAGPQGPGLPADVAFLRVLYRVGDAEPELHVAEVDDLATADGRRRLVLDQLPAESVLSVRVEGQLASGEIGYLGSIGPLRLAGGETLSEQVVLVSANESQSVTSALPPRFLHSATQLADGRVLVSGGFSQPVAADCPVGATQSARCYRAVALKDAWLFDPSRLTFAQVMGGLLEPRAGHSSTLLPDGRVLTAGGAREALLLFDAAAPALPRFIPVDGTGAASASSTFEIFEPEVGATSARDPARGRFVGSALGTTQPAPLLAPRFLHAAADNPAAPGQVLLAGGIGSDQSSKTYEIFDLSRRGGYGTSPLAAGDLTTDRQTPSALALSGGGASAIWIFGGAHARSNEQLAERWTSASSDPRGSLSVATETAFPDANIGASDVPRPEYAFPQVLAARLNGGAQALVAGAYPPYCGDSATPVFPATSLVEVSGACSAQADLKRCLVVDGATGATQPCATLQAHLAGAATELSDGSVLLSGGLSDLAGDMSLSLERLGLMPSDLTKLGALTTLPLRSPRAFHTSTGLPEGGALSVGGLRFDGGVPVLSESAELVRW